MHIVERLSERVIMETFDGDIQDVGQIHWIVSVDGHRVWQRLSRKGMRQSAREQIAKEQESIARQEQARLA